MIELKVGGGRLDDPAGLFGDNVHEFEWKVAGVSSGLVVTKRVNDMAIWHINCYDAPPSCVRKDIMLSIYAVKPPAFRICSVR